MKNKSLLVMSTIALTAVTGFVLIKKNPVMVYASDYQLNTLATTINLNDASESTIRNYYSSLNSLGEAELSGTNLLKNLKPILKNNQKYFSYGESATTAVWQIYEIVDRDWTLSPASAIAGYDAKTNTITNYEYGKSASKPGSNPYIHALYVNRDATNDTKAWGDHTQTNYGINQEHVWPKSLGFEDEEKPIGARGDVMHLWAGNGRVNGQYHKNYYYGYVDKAKTYTDAGSDYSYLSGNLKGYSKTLGGSVTVFEPQDSDKGDIARIIFYMAARYNNFAGSDADGFDSGNPNLEIVNNLTSWSNSGYQSNATTTGKMGILQDLLEWNKLDPVDEWEIHRNNLCFNNYTNNRNPFVDFPEWADYIWGTSTNGTYNAATTGYAKPAEDKINGSSEPVIPTPTSETTTTSETTPTSESQTPAQEGSLFDKVPLWAIIVGGVVLVIIIIVLIVVLSKSKKARKAVKKAIKKQGKKQVKKAVKGSSSKSKK